MVYLGVDLHSNGWHVGAIDRDRREILLGRWISTDPDAFSLVFRELERADGV